MGHFTVFAQLSAMRVHTESVLKDNVQALYYECQSKIGLSYI